MGRCRRLSILLAFLVAAWPVHAAETASARPILLTGSYWYVIDHVTDVAADAEIVLMATLPPSHGSQTIKLGNIYPEPQRIVADTGNENRIVIWRLKPEEGQKQFFFRVDFSGQTHVTLNDVDAAEIQPVSPTSEIARIFTQAEPWLETTQETTATAHGIVGDEQNPYLQAKRIFEWMIDNFEFVPGGSGAPDATSTLQARRGDCGQYSRVFTVLCRSLGIPARTVTNVWLVGGLHRYAEFYVEPYGWLPADVATAQALDPGHSILSAEDIGSFRQAHGIVADDPGWLFGNLYGEHLIITVGNNITLPSTMGLPATVYQVMEPGGTDAFPAAVTLRGLNDDLVQGGFFVFGPPIGPDAALQLAYQKLAGRFFKAGMFEAVEQGCLSLGEPKADSAQHWLNLGRVNLHKREYARAEACLRRALLSSEGSQPEVIGSRIWAHNYLGNCYDLMQRREMAKAEYKRVLKLGIDDHGALTYARRYLAEPFNR